MMHRGDPLNFVANPLPSNDTEEKAYAQQAGEWRLIFNRKANYVDYLGGKDENNYYYGVSHKFELGRIEAVSETCLYPRPRQFCWLQHNVDGPRQSHVSFWHIPKFSLIFAVQVLIFPWEN